MAGSDRAPDPTATDSAAAAHDTPHETPAANEAMPPRMPPTIDLTATELAEDASGQTAQDATEETTTDNNEQPQAQPRPAGASHLVTAVVAGLGGGLIVLIAAIGLWLAGLVPERDGATAALQTRLAAFETQLRDAGNRPDTPASNGLAQRLTALEQTLAKSPREAADPALTERIAAAEQAAKATGGALAGLNARVSEQTERVATLEKAVTEAAKAAAASPAAAAAAASATDAALVARLDGMERAIAAQREAARTGIETAMETAKAAAKEAAKTASETASKPADAATRRAVATLALRDLIASGAPYAAELSAVRSLAASPASEAASAALAPFASAGLPSPAALLQQASALLPALRQKVEAAETAQASSFLDRLEANASRLVRIRPVGGEAAGADPAAILSRAEDSLARRDLAGTLTQIQALPPALRAPADAWIGQVKARQQALDASRQLAADAARRLVEP